MLEAIASSYSQQQDIRYGAARGWVDRIIDPVQTAQELAMALQVASMAPSDRPLKTGVIQT